MPEEEDRLELQVNGRPFSVPNVCSITTLLMRLEAPSEGVAVAVNGHVIPRAEHGEHRLKAKDQVEVIRAVGGG